MGNCLKDGNQKAGVNGHFAEWRKRICYMTKKATSIIRKSSENNAQNFMLPLYGNLAHPHLDHCLWFLSPHLHEVIAQIDKIQRRKL